MRSRLTLFFDDLTLEEILYLDEELDRRKEKYRKQYSILSVQSDPPILRSESHLPLAQLARDLRRYMGDCAAVGGGALLAFSPEVSVMLFHSVEGAGQTCTALVGGLPEFNGKGGTQSYGVGLKMGLATGIDTLSPGSSRCVRRSSLVKRANQCSWRGAASALLMDENSYNAWPAKHTAVRVPMEIDGCQVYRVVPGAAESDSEQYDNEPLNTFLTTASQGGVRVFHYSMARVDTSAMANSGWGKPVAMLELTLQAHDPRKVRHLAYSEKIAVNSFRNRMENIKHLMSQKGFALVRRDAPAAAGANKSSSQVRTTNEA